MKRSIVAVLLVAFPLAASGKLLPEAAKFSECLLVADWTLDAGEALRGGISQERHVAAHENEVPARRATIEAVYRDRPRELSDYIAAKLGSCLRARGADAGDLFAKACYDQTLWARMLFASKRRGVSLERLMEGPLAPLAEAVYRSDLPEAEFRRDLLLDCLSR
jgi:hypothetical protein